MKKRSENEIKEYYRKSLKNKFVKRRKDLIQQYLDYTHGAYKMSNIEADVFSFIDDMSRLKDHCYTASTRALQEFTSTSRSTIVRALRRLEENNIIIKLETTTLVPYYITYELYFARLYHWITFEDYYPECVKDVKKTLNDIYAKYSTPDEKHKAVESLMRRFHVKDIDLTKELKSANFYGAAKEKPTYY